MNLYAFIKRLSDPEIKLIRKLLKRKENAASGQESELRLFEKVISAEEITGGDEHFAAQLQVPADNAFSKLKSKLFYKILDIVSTDTYLQRDDFFGSSNKTALGIRKRILQLKILQSRKANTPKDVIHHLLSEIIDTAKEYELYDSLIEVLRFKKQINFNLKGFKDYQKLDDEITFYAECATALALGRDAYRVIVMNQNLISHFNESDLQEYIDSKIKELESNPYTTISTNIQYYYKMLKLVQSERKKKYHDCIDICLDMLNLLNRSKAIYREDRLGFTYDNLGQYWMLQRNYSNAISTFRRAQEFYPAKSFPYMISKEQEFYACFYGKKYDESRKVLDELLSHDKRDAGEIRYDKFLYYSCCLDFITGKNKDSLRISNLGLQIVKDKSRWEIGLRYMKILNLVELGELVEASDSLESLRKQIKRLTDNNLLEKRDLIIFKCLQQYERDGFGKNASPRLNYLVKRLSKKDVPWTWKYFSHELFPVHRWLRSRLTGSPQKNERIVK
jgi:hypothetical protein